MILHLLRMRRNANRNVFNDRKNVSATAAQQNVDEYKISTMHCGGNSLAIVHKVHLDDP